MPTPKVFKKKADATIKAELDAIYTERGLTLNIDSVDDDGLGNIRVNFTNPPTAEEESIVLGYCIKSQHCELA